MLVDRDKVNRALGVNTTAQTPCTDAVFTTGRDTTNCTYQGQQMSQLIKCVFNNNNNNNNHNNNNSNNNNNNNIIIIIIVIIVIIIIIIIIIIIKETLLTFYEVSCLHIKGSYLRRKLIMFRIIKHFISFNQ